MNKAMPSIKDSATRMLRYERDATAYLEEQAVTSFVNETAERRWNSTYAGSLLGMLGKTGTWL